MFEFKGAENPPTHSQTQRMHPPLQFDLGCSFLPQVRSAYAEAQAQLEKLKQAVRGGGVVAPVVTHWDVPPDTNSP